MPDFTLRMDGKLTLAEMALRHHQIRQRHPGRFWVYIGVDPRQGQAGITEFEGFLEDYGFDGIKLYPPCRVLAVRSRVVPVWVSAGNWRR